MQDHAFVFLVGAALASLVLAVVSMLAEQWRVASWLLVIAVVSLPGVMVVRALELRAQVRP